MSHMLTIAEAAKLIATKQLSPVELVDDCLARIAASDNTLNSFITITAQRAREDAKAAEQRIMKGGLRGKLDGIPIGHKDIYCTRGIATTAHSALLKDWIPTEDAEIVTRLAAAGTSLMGKLATHEFALGGPPFDLPWPPARNPWDTDHFTSGSSSGTAVAIAAGLILGGTGTDTAGSVRGPAALCGIVGIKPTFGLCSRYGVLPLSPSLDHTGPMAWTVEDCAILLQDMAGYDRRDAGSVNRPVADFSSQLGRDVSSLRIGIVRRWYDNDHPISAGVRAGFDKALSVWSDQGAEIVELSLPSLFEYQAANMVIMISEAFAIHQQDLRTRLSLYGSKLRERLVLAALFDEGDYAKALHRRQVLSATTASAAEPVDIIVTPGAASEAPLIERVPQWGDFTHPGYYAPFSLTGWPAMCVCAGFGNHGLPISVQIVAKPFCEALLFQVGYALEKTLDIRGRRPTSQSCGGQRENFFKSDSIGQ